MKASKIEKLFNKTVKSKQIHECVLFIENTTGDISYRYGYGEKDIDTTIIIASITKLFTTTCILILLDQGKLSLNNNITNYFDNKTLSGLHQYNGEEYADKLTIAHLLFQTSGLPDAFEQTKENLKNRVIKEDMDINLNEMLSLTKQLNTHFAPDKKIKHTMQI
ncbi:serine hydrolase [Metabacillus malikii]|uniref:CubicO group peptidase (Beta-lactamase class C family) n=1 Tax=Metabacillus malikii TaxID=1504265 RepID=A0ABT9ZD36_9BACI|nr:serine hydrolase [Metabacillus malikii]MDQ0230147.1 CubicO group peptidase (beta-lactamase class C family) [Metabacillus malikii]